MKRFLMLFLGTNLLFSCVPNKQDGTALAQKIVDKTIAMHGGKNYNTLHIGFNFRDRHYTIQKENSRFQYIRAFSENGQAIKDVLNNEGFQRYINEQITPVEDTMANKYSNAINSVIYFALLPQPLNDSATIKTYKGITTIKNKEYHTIEVSFREKGGGKDFDDLFFYWIDTQNFTVDYLAYLFHVDGGGVRFRVAYNPITLRGIRFQQYENYKADKTIPLAQLPALFENGKLEYLSKIELEAITDLSAK